MVIGSNSILAYIIAAHFMPAFKQAVESVLSGLARHLAAFGPLLVAAGMTAGVWLFLFLLYRNKAFLRL